MDKQEVVDSEITLRALNRCCTSLPEDSMTNSEDLFSWSSALQITVFQSQVLHKLQLNYVDPVSSWPAQL